MKITSTARLEGRGVGLITDQTVPELDWSAHRGTTRIRIQMPDGAEELELEAVELALKDGVEYVGFVVGEHPGVDPNRFVGHNVECCRLGGVAIFTGNHKTRTEHMKRYKRIRIIGGVLLVLGAAMIILALVEGEKSVIQSIGAGGWAIGLGGALFGMSLRLENKGKASRGPSDTPKS